MADWVDLSVWGNTAEISARLQEISYHLDDMDTLLSEIGVEIQEAIKHRFVTLTDPAGFEWEPNSPITIERKGPGKPPLTGITGMLQQSINYNVISNTAVEIGSPMAYAKTMQWGGWSHWREYGEWWRVPPRNFVGLSLQDAGRVLQLTERYLARL